MADGNRIFFNPKNTQKLVHNPRYARRVIETGALGVNCQTPATSFPSSIVRPLSRPLIYAAFEYTSPKMPPRKSNVSAVSATGDEGTPVKEKERDGINVEVRIICCDILQSYKTELHVGPRPPPNNGPTPRQRRPPLQHANRQRRHSRDVEIRDRLR